MPAGNIKPIAHAGKDQTITIPIDSAILSGSGTDADGTVVGYSWKQISGPSASKILFPNLSATLTNNLVSGTYEYELTVTDNMGATGRDIVIIVVGAPRLNPDLSSNNIKIYPNPVIVSATLEINITL